MINILLDCLNLGKSTLQISVKIPEKLAEQLYCCLIPYVPTCAIDQETILLGKYFKIILIQY